MPQKGKRRKKNNDGGVNTRSQWRGGWGGWVWVVRRGSAARTRALSGSSTAVPSAANKKQTKLNHNNKTGTQTPCAESRMNKKETWDYF